MEKNMKEVVASCMMEKEKKSRMKMKKTMTS